jgi:hypothetical protein
MREEVWLPPWLEQHRHRAWIGDVLLAAAQVVLILKMEPKVNPVDVVLAALAVVAVLARRRWPERVLWAATGVAVLTLITGTSAAGWFITGRTSSGCSRGSSAGLAREIRRACDGRTSPRSLKGPAKRNRPANRRHDGG